MTNGYRVFSVDQNRPEQIGRIVASMLGLAALAIFAGCETLGQGPAINKPVAVSDVGDRVALRNYFVELTFDRAAGAVSARSTKGFRRELLTDVPVPGRVANVDVEAVQDGDEIGQMVVAKMSDGRVDRLIVWRGSPIVSWLMTNESPAAMTVPIDLGPGNYFGYDNGSNKFIQQTSYTVEATLDPGVSRLIAFRKIESPPTVLGSDDDDGLFYPETFAQAWDEDEKTLTCASRVKAGKPHEVRLFVPAWLRGKATVSEADRAAGVLIFLKRSGAFHRATIESDAARTVNWSVKFE